MLFPFRSYLGRVFYFEAWSSSQEYMEEGLLGIFQNNLFTSPVGNMRGSSCIFQSEKLIEFLETNVKGLLKFLILMLLHTEPPAIPHLMLSVPMVLASKLQIDMPTANFLEQQIGSRLWFNSLSHKITSEYTLELGWWAFHRQNLKSKKMIHYLQRKTNTYFSINVFENYTTMHIIKRPKKKIPNTEFYTLKRYTSKIKVKTSNVSFDV